MSPHTEIVDELLCVVSLLVSVAPEESCYLRQVHRVLGGKSCGQWNTCLNKDLRKVGGHEEVLQRGLELDGDLLFKGGDAFCLREQDEYMLNCVIYRNCVK